MAKEFVADPRDLYKKFRFRVSIEGRIVAAVTETTGLSPEPGTPKKKSKKKMPGMQKFGNLTLKRGMITDRLFLDWINDIANQPEAKDLRKNMILEYCNEAGELISSYRVINGWPTKIEGPDLDAKGNEVTIETIELSYEGLELIKS